MAVVAWELTFGSRNETNDRVLFAELVIERCKEGPTGELHFARANKSNLFDNTHRTCARAFGTSRIFCPIQIRDTEVIPPLDLVFQMLAHKLVTYRLDAELFGSTGEALKLPFELLESAFLYIEDSRFSCGGLVRLGIGGLSAGGGFNVCGVHESTMTAPNFAVNFLSSACLPNRFEVGR